MANIADLFATVRADTSDFDRGMDNVQSRSGEAGRGMDGMTLASTTLGVALGNLISGAAAQFGEWLMALPGQAVAAVANMQYMQIGLDTLLAKELAQNSGEDQMVETGMRLVAATEDHMTVVGKTKKSVGELTFELQGAELALRRQEDAYNKLSSSGKATQLQMDTSMHTVEGARNAYQLLAGQLQMVPGTAETSVMGFEKVRVGVKNIAEVMPQAEEAGKKLMQQLGNIAILSPYTLPDVLGVQKMAMVFGYSAESARTFTSALLDVAAGVGASGPVLERMTYHLGQIRMQGSVGAMQVRQLALTGFDLNGVLRFMGQQMHLNINDYQDFNKEIKAGTITWDDFARLFSEYSKTNFAGASERMSRSLKGLSSTLSDVFNLTMPDLLGPALDHITQLASNMLSTFLRLRESGVFVDMGESLNKSIGPALDGLVNKWGITDFVMSAFVERVGKGKEPIMALAEALRLVPPKTLEAEKSTKTLTTAMMVWSSAMSLSKDPATALHAALLTLVPQPVADAVWNVAKEVQKLGPSFDEAIGMISKGDIFGGIMKALTIPGSMGVVASNLANELGKSLEQNTDQGPTGSIARGIGHLITGATEALKSLPGVGDIFKAIFGDSTGQQDKVLGIAQGFERISATLKNDLPAAAQSLRKFWDDNAGPILSGFGEALGKLPGLVDDAIGKLSNGDFAGAAKGLIVGIGTAITKWVGDDLVPGAKNLIGKLKDGLTDNLPKWNDFVQSVTDGIGTVFKSLSATDLNGLIDGIKGLVGTMLAYLVAPVENLRDQAVLPLVANLGKAIGETAGNVVLALASWVSIMTGFPGTIDTTSLKPGAKLFVDNLSKALLTVSDTLYTTGSLLLHSVMIGFRDGLGIQGPSMRDSFKEQLMADAGNKWLEKTAAEQHTVMPVIMLASNIQDSPTWKLAQAEKIRMEAEIDKKLDDIFGVNTPINVNIPVSPTPVFVPQPAQSVQSPTDTLKMGTMDFLRSQGEPIQVDQPVTVKPIFIGSLDNPKDGPTAAQAYTDYVSRLISPTDTPITTTVPVSPNLVIDKFGAGVVSQFYASPEFAASISPTPGWVQQVPIAIQPIVTAVPTAPEQALSSLQTYQNMKDAGYDFAKGIPAGFDKAKPDVIKAIKGLGEAGTEWWTAFYQIHSPSKVTASTLGLPFGQGIAIGVTQSYPEFTAALSGYSTIIMNVAGQMIAAAPAIGIGIIDGIVAGMKQRATELFGADAAGLGGIGKGGNGTGGGGGGNITAAGLGTVAPPPPPRDGTIRVVNVVISDRVIASAVIDYGGETVDNDSARNYA